MFARRKKKNKEHTIAYRKILRMLWPSLRIARVWFFLFVPLAIIAALTTIGEPYIYGSIVDTLIASVSQFTDPIAIFSSVTNLLLGWIVLVVIATIVSALYSYFSWVAANLVLEHFITRYFSRVLHLDTKTFEDERAGELLEKFNRSWDAVWWLSNFFFNQMLGMFFVFVGVVIFGLLIDIRLGLVALIPIPFVIFASWMNIRWSGRHQLISRTYWERIGGHVADSYANIMAVKNAAAEKRSIRRLVSWYRLAYRKQLKVDIGWAAVDSAQGGIYVAGRLLLFASGVWWIAQGSTTIGVLVMFSGLSGKYYGSIQQILAQAPHALRLFTALERARKLWEGTPDVPEAEHAKRLKSVKGHIVVDDLSFAYKDGRMVLRDVSFEVQPGQTIAIIGESGAGKSTLAKLFPRFYDPTEGAIYLDGTDLRELNVADLRTRVGFVMQENLLFHDTILKNIAYAKPGASKRAIIAAAKRAQVHEFIKGLSKGYQTKVGERGVRLSGGQKQRIALARILLADPPILVLDEATSALDSKTEYALQAALSEVFKDRTTLVIAHRLSTVMAADKIFVFDKGRIVDQGTHEDLLKRGGLYEEYWKIQAGGYV